MSTHTTFAPSSASPSAIPPPMLGLVPVTIATFPASFMAGSLAPGGLSMDLTGRYIGIWVTAEEMEAIFGFEPAATSAIYMLRGKVLGETDEVGLWIELQGVSAPPEDLFPDIAAEKPRRLIRWEFIHSA